MKILKLRIFSRNYITPIVNDAMFENNRRYLELLNNVLN